jgi:hypothetical protein
MLQIGLRPTLGRLEPHKYRLSVCAGARQSRLDRGRQFFAAKVKPLRRQYVSRGVGRAMRLHVRAG